MKLTRKVISGMLSVSLSVTLLTGIPYNVNNNGIKAKAESVAPSNTITTLETDVETASEGCTMLGVYGSYYSQAKDALNRINEIRKEACEDGNVPDPENPSRMLSPSDYVPAKWSKDLESIARIRAMEGGLALKFLSSGHSRLNGKNIWSVQYNGVRSYAENLAYNWNTSMVSGINQWYEEKNDWVGQSTEAVTGHYTSIINPKYTYIGLGDFYTEEAQYPNTLAGAFCSSSEDLDQSMQEAQADIMQKIEVKDSYISGYTLEGSNTINAGSTTKLELRVNLTNNSKILKLWIPGPVTYTSSDTSIAQVTDTGTVTGLGAGTATITVQSGNNELASMLITVNLAETPEPIVTPSPTPAQTPVITPSPEVTQKPIESVSPSPEDTQTPTASPFPTITPAQTPTASPLPSVKPSLRPETGTTPSATPAKTPAPATEVTSPDEGYEKPSGINVKYHTQEEIRNYARTSGVSLKDALEFDEEPVTESPYSLGKLSDTTLQSALKMLNQVRYIAGISDNVELSDEYNNLCQAASLVNYANNKLSHYPEKPDGMSDDMYKLAKRGAGSSNIALSSACSLNRIIISSWMEDGDNSNIDRVGHRRWIINPFMGKTGFGAVSGKNGTYSSLYSLDTSNRSAEEYGVAWPSQNMPVEYFGTDFPWSVSMGTNVNKSKIKVTLTRKNDGKTWDFQDSSSDGKFYVNNNGYGQKGCIIFRPEDKIKYNAGDVFKVEITGLDTPVSYTVNFFELNPTTVTPSPAPSPVITPTVPETSTLPSEKPSTAPSDNPSYVNPAPVTPGIVPEPSIAPVVNINQKVSVGSMAYKVTSVNGAKTVEYTGTKRNINKIVIPVSIKINGDNYKVTSIAKNGFKGNKKLSKVTIGANIKKIGKNAFLNCSNLKNIVIKTKKLTAKTVGKNAFKGINKKAIIKVPGSKIRAYSKIIKTKGATGRINIKK